MNKKLWFLKIFAIGASLGIVVWAIEALKHHDVQNVGVPAVTHEMPNQPIPARVQTGPRDRRDR